MQSPTWAGSARPVRESPLAPRADGGQTRCLLAKHQYRPIYQLLNGSLTLAFPQGLRGGKAQEGNRSCRSFPDMGGGEEAAWCRVDRIRSNPGGNLQMLAQVMSRPQGLGSSSTSAHLGPPLWPQS